MIEREPMEVGTEGRVYTSSEQRRELGLDGYGYGVSVVVEVMSVDRSREWGVHAESVVFTDELGTYGEFRIPAGARESLDVSVGESVRVSVEVQRDE